MIGKKDCKFCEKNGLLWLPLRYSVVSSEYPTAFKTLPKIGGKKLGQGVTDIKLTDPKSMYAVRLMRPGYLYLLLEHLGLRYWRAYQVLDDAYLYEFSPEDPPQIEPQFSCDPTLCGVNASMVSIPDPRNVKKLWTFFTHAPLTKTKLSEYKENADAYANEGRMQTFSPAGWLSGETDQVHSLLGPELLTTVAEYRLFVEPGNPASPFARPFATPLSQAMREQLFPATRDAYADAIPNEKGVYGGRLGALQDLIQRNGYAAFVLQDHIGITQELNDHRNDAFYPVDQFLGKTEGSGPNNRWKFDVYQKIDKWRNLIDNGLVTDAENSIERNDLLRRAQREPIFSDDSEEMQRAKCEQTSVHPTHAERKKFPMRHDWESDHPKIAEELAQALLRDEDAYIEFAHEKARHDWRDKYAPQLDLAEMERFSSKLKEMTELYKEGSKIAAPQHISWLKSPRVLFALDVCDRHDTISGEALGAQVYQCIVGMEGSKEAEGILSEWGTAKTITRENLLLRAFTRDQVGVKKAVDNAFLETTIQAADTKESSIKPVTAWPTAIKGLISAMKSTDSALDEWMRQQEQNRNYLNPKHIANVEARFFYFVSSVTRAVARKGIGGKIEMGIVARANALLISRLGDLATKLEHDTLSARIDPNKWSDIKQKYKDADAQSKTVEARKNAQQRMMHRLAQRAKFKLERAAVDLISDAQCKAKLQIAISAKNLGWNDLQKQLEDSARRHRNYEEAANELKKQVIPAKKVPAVPSPTNNYHQARIGGALAAVETLALLGKVSNLKDLGFNMATGEVVASAFSLSSIVTDLMYTYTKSIRELPHYAAIDGIKKGADIVRGGYKITAGSLATMAGIFTAFSDWQKSDQINDPVLSGILRFRAMHSGISAIFGSLVAFSYTGPLLEHLAAKDGRSKFASKFFIGAAEYATDLSERVVLLRIVAWLGWIGVAITIGDLVYAGYRWYLDYTAVTRWLGRCTFRKIKVNKTFSTAAEEMEEFDRAKSLNSPRLESENLTFWLPIGQSNVKL